MTTIPPARTNLRTWVSGLAASLLLPCVALAGGQESFWNAPNAASVISRADLAKLPMGRDLVQVLDLHNQARAEVGSPPLQWNVTLATHAQKYAEVVAETGQLKHSSRVGRENERENLAAGPRAGNSPLSMAQTWRDEGRYFRPGTFPNVCVGDWSRCAHYTQMIWSTTTDIGCGFASRTYDALVCRYSPPGNKDGRPVVVISPRAAH